MSQSAIDEETAPQELVRLLQLSDRREPVVADIAVWIARGIIDGRIQPGQTLNSVDIASQFGTSRTPVREALAILESDGLLEMRARKRPRVVLYDSERIKEVFFLRATIMAALAEAAAERITQEDLTELVSLVDVLAGHARESDDARYRWAHFQFFDAIVEIAGNKTARPILNSLFLRTLSIRQALAAPDRLQESLSYAEQILQALMRRDGEMAALLVRRSIEAAVQGIDRTDKAG
ncbi:MAG: GntR family transcriptional regulator [Microbacterium sp.]|uniref:GntR family transcriptional regulator n=1 Tax=Microbacterium sp. TaxID=51671 RepID=UPI003F7DFAE2